MITQKYPYFWVIKNYRNELIILCQYTSTSCLIGQTTGCRFTLTKFVRAVFYIHSQTRLFCHLYQFGFTENFITTF